MEPNDPELRKLLREWEVPATPPSLERRILGNTRPRTTWWRALLTGYIRVPVPVGVVMAIALVVLGALAIREQRPAPTGTRVEMTVDLKRFQPVQEVKVRVIRRNYAN
jgi:hypothetical protein